MSVNKGIVKKLVTRGFELVTLGFELATLGFELKLMDLNS